MKDKYKLEQIILKHLRSELCLSQRALANILGITRTAISNYECGSRYPDLKIAYKILDLAATKGITLSLEDIYPRKLIYDEIISSKH